MKPETLGEVHIMFQNLLVRVDELNHKIEENTKISTEGRDQALKTNGRVTLLEKINREDILPVITDYKERRANVRGMIILVSVSGLAILGLLGFTTNLYINNMKIEIAETVANQTLQTLTKNYDITIK